MISNQIIKLLRKTFQLNWNGVHGVSHWARVRLNGLMLSEENDSNKKVLELFAFFHDSMRMDEFSDEMHGYRASDFVETLSCEFLGINDQEKQLLITACRHHTDREYNTNDITILTCWDADALDLGRVGIIPVAERLNTEVAKQPQIIEWCYKRSIEIKL